MNFDQSREPGGGTNGHLDASDIARGATKAALLREAPAGEAGIPRLLWRDPEGSVRAAEVSRALTVGRAPGCAVELSHAGVSWVHALIGPNDSSFWIVDLSSAGGTTLNGHRVGEVLSPLQNGDVIELGGFPLAFVK